MRIGFKVLLMVTLASLLAVAVSLAACVLIHDIPPAATVSSVAAGTGVILLSVTVGFAVIRQITAPLRQLTVAAERFAKGDFGCHVDATSSDEMGMLGRIFNTMSEEIKRAKAKEQRYQQDLEREVQRKTAELHQKVEELEEFTKLSVGRELRMVELKREVAELRGPLGRRAAKKGKGPKEG